MEISFRELKASSKPIPIDNNLVIEMTNYFFENYFSNDGSFERKFQLKDIKNNIINFVFLIVYKDLNINDFIGDSGIADRNEEVVLFIECNKNYSKEKVRNNLENNRKYIISTISHELSHLTDKILKKEENDTGVEKGEEYYFNMSKERKAYLQQIVYEIASMRNNLKYDKDKLTLENIKDLLDLSSTYKAVNKYFNEKTKKTIYQVIYNLIKSGEIKKYEKN